MSRHTSGRVTRETNPFPALFSPFSVAGLELRNRIVMTAMGTRLSRDGLVGEADVAWLEERARGGVGLIVTGGQLPSASAGFGTVMGVPGNASGLVEAYRDTGITRQRTRVDAVHRHGARIIGQLVHPGREALSRPGTLGEAVAVAPSGVTTAGGSDLPHALSTSEIRQLVGSFGHSAANLQAAGVDGIEVHAAHGYLIAQFLSPLANRRRDEYGAGSIDDRARFLLEVISEIRRRCGAPFVVGVRLSAEEEVPGGITLDETLAITERLTGQVDYLSVTVGVRGNYVKDHTSPPGVAVRHAAAVKAATTLPVIVAGRITTPALAEAILESGAADLVGMGRALIADPRFAVKAASGSASSIRPCIGFVQDCRQFLGGVLCGVNASASRERTWSELDEPRARRTVRVVIVGGGPGGLEAARLAAERGHRVVLYERAGALGGQVLLAARSPHRGEMGELIRYLEHEVRRLGVDVRTGVDATAAHVTAEEPDVVVVATGARPPAAMLPGSGVPVLGTWDVLERDSLGVLRRALVVDDGTGFWPMCSAAERLAELGAAVEIVAPAQGIGMNIPAESAAHLHRRLRSHGVTYTPFTRLRAVTGAIVTVADTITGDERSIETDLVVLQVPSQPVLDAVGYGDPVAVEHIGDCVAPRRLSNAVFEANRVIRGLDDVPGLPRPVPA